MTKRSPRIAYAATVYGSAEVRAVMNVLSNPIKLVSGPLVKQFERRIARLFGKPFGVMVNSGSSANLLALEVLDLPKGSEVITPALTFSTTLAPILQQNLTPVFADIDAGFYTINIDQIERLITRRTKAIFIPSLIGNIPDLKRLSEIAKAHKLRFIEDSCDTLGARFAGRPTGVYSDVSTTSFYASHIITAAASGGMVCFRDPVLARRALLKSNWGRESTLFGPHELSEDLKKRFAGRIGQNAYDAKFIFSEVGYNFQPTEINAAFGLAQLKRLALFKKIRQQNFASLLNFFRAYEDIFILPRQHLKTDTAWLALPLTIRKGAKFSRNALTYYLEKRNIQTRPIFTGNVLRQPAFKNIRARRLRSGYPMADEVMRGGFLIGCHHGLSAPHLSYIKEAFEAFLKAK